MFALLAITNLLAAGLVFTVQPLISKLALPQFGGSAMVWSTALMIFQGGLLLGYLYAHALSRLASVTTQTLVHALVAGLSVLLLPVVFTTVGAALHPSLTLSLSLLASVGLPYFLVCTTSPLTQRWYFEWTGEKGRDPYVLYSVSNVGSLLALLSYPFLIEPNLDTDSQRVLWSGGYVALLITLVSFMLVRRSRQRVQLLPLSRPEPSSWLERGRWVGFAFVPSLYLMGVTLHIGIDVAAAPFIWVIPLVLYLLSFVLVFARPGWGTHPGLLTTQACVVIALCIYFYYTDLIFLLLLHLAGLFLACMVCHGRLVAHRPPAGSLTEFYIWMALGGWLGGVVGSLIAPVAFNDNWEYLLAIAASVLLRPNLEQGSTRMDLLAPCILAVVVIGLVALELPVAFESYLVFGVFVVGAYAFRARVLRFGLAVIPLLLGIQLLDTQEAELRDRSFYGIYEIASDGSGSLKQLTHGTTLHGSQALDPALQVLPLEYYHPAGPLGQVMVSRRDEEALEDVAVVGLGVGTIACYALPDTRMTFYEIDPLIVTVARDHFTYLQRCAPSTRVVVGDGRLSLERDADARFDVLVIDAFSSDAVPLHLLTTEAMALYLSKLKPDGVLLVHVSNRYVELAGTLGQLAAANGATAFFQAYEPGEAEERQGATASDWVLISKEPGPLSSDPRWVRLPADSGHPLWTDRYSNLLDVIGWEALLWVD